MTDPPRDWDKELAKIDRAMARLPEPAAQPPGPGRPAAAPAGEGRAPERPGPGAATATWLRVLLVLTLAVAMPLWPYSKECGFGLLAYLAACSVVVLAGGWAAVSTWQRRRPVGHILAILVLVWGLGLLAAEVLPRVGYAKSAIRWTCG